MQGRLSPTQRWTGLPFAARRTLTFTALALLLGAALVLGVGQGAVYVPPLEVLQALLGQRENPIVTELRLPRVLGAMLVGAALGLAGAAYQGLFRNPLADPYLMGVAAGASFGFTLTLSLSGALAGFGAGLFFSSLPTTAALGAFLGALLAVFLTLILAGGSRSGQHLILAGVVVGSVLTGFSTLLLLLDTDRIREVFSYTLGSLAFMGWRGVGLLSAGLAFAMPLLWGLARALNALALGEETARSLGLPLSALRLVLIGLSTLLTSLSVVHAGIIGFVGFVAPHALRQLVGGDYRYLLPASALGGALLLALADWAARVVVRPAELPVGVITTLLGGPFFLYLLWRARRGLQWG
ncbi:MAG: iron ABC transporter permease [Meiothermus sp.]|uniref:FecCD family ABC transporter permease n=1 Tax=Meiothermus sp. TaxID=1955249 RepID=UPI0025FE77C8|nr:iron ABC transporter permease [Meiothermus sp.]MCS7058055.1 iron ABC transporter permease [Meiothermus sp.]MCS7194973.1 iron ABC transporter permease [Meiothermus sp.]MCX7740139.1 iron ABC transporter permease [Meiothermus sp.]MDW8091841.1 iron ABC transporter permease [Meiothermus sp.]MDW8482614.1 iron ABC transporter permease [Meiothermus sp.]